MTSSTGPRAGQLTTTTTTLRSAWGTLAHDPFRLVGLGGWITFVDAVLATLWALKIVPEGGLQVLTSTAVMLLLRNALTTPARAALLAQPGHPTDPSRRWVSLMASTTLRQVWIAIVVLVLAGPWLWLGSWWASIGLIAPAMGCLALFGISVGLSVWWIRSRWGIIDALVVQEGMGWPNAFRAVRRAPRPLLRRMRHTTLWCMVGKGVGSMFFLGGTIPFESMEALAWSGLARDLLALPTDPFEL